MEGIEKINTEEISNEMKISRENEVQVISKLRKYYKKNFRNGDSDESFLMWIENILFARKR